MVTTDDPTAELRLQWRRLCQVRVPVTLHGPHRLLTDDVIVYVTLFTQDAPYWHPSWRTGAGQRYADCERRSAYFFWICGLTATVKLWASDLCGKWSKSSDTRADIATWHLPLLIFYFVLLVSFSYFSPFCRVHEVSRHSLLGATRNYGDTKATRKNASKFWIFFHLCKIHCG